MFSLNSRKSSEQDFVKCAETVVFSLTFSTLMILPTLMSSLDGINSSSSPPPPPALAPFGAASECTQDDALAREAGSHPTERAELVAPLCLNPVHAVAMAGSTLTCLGEAGVGRVGQLAQLGGLKLLPDWLQQLVEGHFNRGLQVSWVDGLAETNVANS